MRIENAPPAHVLDVLLPQPVRGGDMFERTFNEATRRESEVSRRETNPQSRVEDGSAHPVERERPPERERPANEADEQHPAAEQPHDEQDYAAAEELTAAYAPIALDAQIVYDELMSKVAEVLEVVHEQLDEMMEAANIKLPELTKPGAVVTLLQTLYTDAEPAELLSMPEFYESYKALNKIVAEMEVVAPKAADAPATDMVKPADTPAQPAIAVELPDLSALKAVVEDGELVVLDMEEELESLEAARFDADEAQIAARTTVGTSQTQTSAAQTIAVPESTVQDIPQDLLPTQSTAPIGPAESPTPTAATHATPQPTPQQAEIADQIINHIKLTNFGANFTEMRMTLRPESLGEIALRVIIQNGLVTASFEAESQRIKEAIEASFNNLRDALTEQGIRFDTLSVYVRQENSQHARHLYERGQNARRRVSEAEEEQTPAPVVSDHTGAIDLRV